MIAVEDRQQLAELVDVADIAVRVASQLRLARRGCPVRDREALLRSIEFLDTAIAGGQFISTGQVAGLQPTLTPLTWAADLRFSPPTVSSERTTDPEQYAELVNFLISLKDVVQRTLHNLNPDLRSTEDSIEFFSRLGRFLGTKADQFMRNTSALSTSSLATFG